MAIKQVEMNQEKNCKHVVKYRASDPEAVVDNLYLAKTAFPDGMPEKIFVAVSDDPIVKSEKEEKAKK